MDSNIFEKLISDINPRDISQIVKDNEWLESIYSHLSSGNEEAARAAAHNYLPCNYTEDFHYAFYCLEEVCIFSDEYLDINKLRYGVTFAKVVEDQILKCRQTDQTEIVKLLQWFKASDIDTQNKILLGEDVLNTLNEFVKRGWNSPTAVLSQLINTYRDKFEQSIYFNYFANLILISQGKDFDPQPFKTYNLKLDGNRIHTSRLKKNMAATWLLNNSQGKFKQLLRRSYDIDIRNTAAHSDFVPNLDNLTYTTSEGSVYKVEYVAACLKNITKLQTITQIKNSIKLFEYGELKDMIPIIGNLDWYYTKRDNTIHIAQYFGNFTPNLKLKRVSIYTPPVDGKEHIVSLGLNDLRIFPYDLRIIPNKTTLKMLTDLSEADNVRCIRTSIAPDIFPFNSVEGIKSSEWNGVKRLLLGQKVDTEVVVEKQALLKTIENVRAYLL